MASFTGLGDALYIKADGPDQEILISISGTYNMDISLERAVGSPGSAYELIESFNTPNDTVSYNYVSQYTDEQIRLYANEVTSGTAVVTFTPSPLPGAGNFGTAAYEDVGTAIGEVVQLENNGGSASLPAVDGSQLTGISGSGATVHSGTGTNTESILPNESIIVVTTISGSPGITSGTYRPQSAETDDVTAEASSVWISDTDEVSVRIYNAGGSTISSSALTVTSYVVSKS